MKTKVPPPFSDLPTLFLHRINDTHDAELDANEGGYPLCLSVFVPEGATANDPKAAKALCDRAMRAVATLVGVKRMRVNRLCGSKTNAAGYGCAVVAREDSCLQIVQVALAILSEVAPRGVKVTLGRSVLDGWRAEGALFEQVLP